jgi:hypothetical protein
MAHRSMVEWSTDTPRSSSSPQGAGSSEDRRRINGCRSNHIDRKRIPLKLSMPIRPGFGNRSLPDRPTIFANATEPYWAMTVMHLVQTAFYEVDPALDRQHTSVSKLVSGSSKE